jgi:membrane protease YdiL (CAAX protease family)
MTFPWKPTFPFFGASHAFAILVVCLAGSTASSYVFPFGFGFLEEILRTVWPNTFESVNLDYVTELATSIVQEITVGIVMVLMIRYFSRAMSMDLWSRMGWSAFRCKHVLWGFLGGGLLGLLVLSFRLAISLENDGPVNTNPDISLTIALFLGFYAFWGLCLVPLTEELLFRGVLYLGFSHSWGNPWALLE